MSLVCVDLVHRPEQAWLRPLTGHDVLAVGGTTTHDAVALLERLVVERPQAIAPAETRRLTTTDRDRLLLALYRTHFGSHKVTTLRCSSCGAPFDLSLDLGNFATTLDEAGPAEIEIGDLLIRLPTAEDELATPDSAALLQRLVLRGDARGHEAEIEATLEAHGPTGDVTLDLTCPECGASVKATFSLQHYALTELVQVSTRLTVDLHLLASTYHWSPDAILDLSHDMRTRLVGLVEDERSAIRSLA